jgi:hemerythrin-like domain-containing protein
MKYEEILNREHHLLLRMMKVLKAIGVEAGARKSFDEKDLEAVLYLLDVFVDEDHEGKEEFCLFPIAMERVSADAFSQLQERVFEHNQERSLIEGLRESLKTRDSEDVAYYASRLAEFLTEHIRKEYQLLKDVAKVLTPDDDRKVVQEFAKIDAALAPRLQEALSRLDSLVLKYQEAA